MTNNLTDAIVTRIVSPSQIVVRLISLRFLSKLIESGHD